MKNEMIISNGVRIEFTENGVKVISTDGELIRFDCTGRLLRKEVFCKAESFMEYFDFMGSEEQRIAKEWAETAEGETNEQDKFIELTKEAGSKIKEDYYIANIEPSIDKTGKIYYKKGEVVALGLSCNQWKERAHDFAPECESELATVYQLVLWYAYRIAKGCWTIEYVCDDSSIAGNYWNSPNAAHNVEVSGAREVGGARDGVGNTCKVVTDGDAGFGLFGGNYSFDGGEYPVADVSFIDGTDFTYYNGSGVVVLNKVRSTEH